MAKIVPSVTPTADIADYNAKLDRVKFADRLHLDFGDGVLTPVKSLNLIQAHWPVGKQIDMHLMYEDPTSQIPTLISQNPNLVILHAEAKVDLAPLFSQLKAVGIKTGLALLQSTTVASARGLISGVDHVLIFSGTLGSYGGQADLTYLTKVNQVKQIKPTVEISWDGGVNEQNVAAISTAGVDVLIAGGAIQRADDAHAAYNNLQNLASQQATV